MVVEKEEKKRLKGQQVRWKGKSNTWVKLNMSSRFRSTLPTSSIFSTTLDMIWSTLCWIFFLYIDLGESVVDTKLFTEKFSNLEIVYFKCSLRFQFSFFIPRLLILIQSYCYSLIYISIATSISIEFPWCCCVSIYHCPFYFFIIIIPHLNSI